MTDNNTEDKYALHEAIRQGKTLLAKHMIDTDAKQILIKDDDDRSPLHWACSMNNLELVEYIIKPRPTIKNLDIDEMEDAGGWTPLHIAASVGNLSIFELLVTKLDADVNETTSTGVAPIHLAISKNHYDIVKRLVEDFKASCRVKDKKGFTPLHRAAAIGSQPIIKLLVEKGKVNINAKDNEGWTALHHALAEGHGDAGVLLVSLGADATIENVDGDTPIKVAVDEKVAKYFKDHI
ncbi:ankyrin repeat-containing domain protein [Scheffersomyces amazonensis]|uniref:ankyrin repeat-containing domain protein n=1 Tax=Scheffersomyces amazonensis TaxID=1078765 RepID=UPI00315CBBF4